MPGRRAVGPAPVGRLRPIDGLNARKYSFREYFDLDASSVDHWEFRHGDVLCMSGGSASHGLIVANVNRAIGNRLEGSPCRTYSGSLRVRVARGTLYSHPDVTVICGPAELDPDDERGETVVNPRLVVEVLSPSAELYDRTEKFERYCRLPSFQEYVLVSQFAPGVETIRRMDDGGWRLQPVAGLDRVARLASVDVDLPLADVYAGVTFPPPEPELSD